jgi:hypothetical protein
MFEPTARRSQKKQEENRGEFALVGRITKKWYVKSR